MRAHSSSVFMLVVWIPAHQVNTTTFFQASDFPLGHMDRALNGRDYDYKIPKSWMTSEIQVSQQVTVLFSVITGCGAKFKHPPHLIMSFCLHFKEGFSLCKAFASEMSSKVSESHLKPLAKKHKGRTGGAWGGERLSKFLCPQTWQGAWWLLVVLQTESIYCIYVILRITCS